MAISKLPTSASLKQVMDKFEEISLYDFSNIDIITASELPVSGKESQVCVITDVKPNKIIVDFDSSQHSFNNNDVFLKCYINDGVSYNFTIKSNNVEVNVNLRECLIKKNGAFVKGKAYIYIDGVWVDMDADMILYNAPYFYNQNLYGSFDRYSHTEHIDSAGLYSEFYHNKDGYMFVRNKGNSYNTSEQTIFTTNAINMTAYNKIQFDIKVVIVNGEFSLGSTSDKRLTINPRHTFTSNFDGVIEVDVSSIKQDMYVGFSSYANIYSGDVKVTFRSIKFLT